MRATRLVAAIWAAAATAAALLALAAPRPGAAPEETDGLAVVYDSPSASSLTVPLWLQDDPQWSGEPYAGSTVGEAGCGLACAAMAVHALTGTELSPGAMAAAAGDSCLTDGVNDMGKFCEWIGGRWEGVRHSEIYYDLGRALEDVSSGSLVFAGVRGDLGPESYGGHVVLIWRSDGDGFWLRDPASAENSSRPFSRSELEQSGFRYFYAIGRS